MQCDVCLRRASSTLPFNCTVCARDILYQPRLKHAQLLLEKESIEKQVERSISGGFKPAQSSSSASLKKQETSSAWTIQRASADQVTSEETTQTIHTHIGILRQEIQSVKSDIAARKERLLRRRSELSSGQKELSHSQATSLEPVEKSIRRTTHNWDLRHSKIVESRLLLCKEAAHVYGLQHHKRTKGARGRDVYTIRGTSIIDLRDLNNASPTDINVSINHIAHLVHLSSHYLSLKLPAEIILPHKNYPTPTILSPSSSYTTSRPIPFPGITPSHSPEASRHKDHTFSNTTSSNKSNDTRPLPRPRILHLSKPLPTLAKDDQLTYANLVEAITFLAWDVAWLCRTQGHPVGQTSWEDVCALGRNLYQLLLAPAPPPPPTPLQPTMTLRSPLPSSPRSVSPATKSPLSQQQHSTLHKSLSRRRTSATVSPGDKPPLAPSPPVLPPAGHFSHNTSYAFLATATGNAYMQRSWRLASAVKAVERVKGMLLAERTGAEWEILEGEEWAAAGTGDDNAVGVGVGVGGDGDGVVEIEDEEEEGGGDDVFDMTTGGLRGKRGEGENEDGDGDDDDGGLLGLGRTGVLVKPASRGKASVAIGAPSVEGKDGGVIGSQREKEKGAEREKSNGWMKLKSRGVPTSTPSAPSALGE